MPISAAGQQSFLLTAGVRFRMRESADDGSIQRGQRGRAAVHEPYRWPHRLALRAGQLGAHLQAAEALGQAKQGVGVDPSGCVVVHVQRVGLAHCVAIIIIIINSSSIMIPRALGAHAVLLHARLVPGSLAPPRPFTPTPRSPNKLYHSHTAAAPQRRVPFGQQHSTATHSAPLPHA